MTSGGSPVPQPAGMGQTQPGHVRFLSKSGRASWQAAMSPHDPKLIFAGRVALGSRVGISVCLTPSGFWFLLLPGGSIWTT
jgi:hypothetical protein